MYGNGCHQWNKNFAKMVLTIISSWRVPCLITSCNNNSSVQNIFFTGKCGLLTPLRNLRVSNSSYLKQKWLLRYISSVQFSRSVVSNFLRPHEPQHAMPPCPLPAPRVHPNPCPLSQWCHPTISSSVVPFSSCPQSFPASGSFPMRQFFASGGQSIGVSASASVLPMNIQDWFPLGWTGLISLKPKGLSRVFSNTTVQKHQFFSTQLKFIYTPTLSSVYDYWKNHSLD